MGAACPGNRVVVTAFDAAGRMRTVEISRKDVERFSWRVVDGIYAGRFERDDFAMGYLSALDVLTAGRHGVLDPVDEVAAAWSDANGRFADSSLLTDVLRRNVGRLGNGRR